MDGMTKKEAAVAWGWLLEALASFKEVDLELLHDLIDMAPDLPEDLEEKVKERVALRCLEDIFPPDGPLQWASTHTHHARISFDFSERCDDVLQRVLNESLDSDFEMVGLWKWEVYPFIMHKRASMPKCVLSQLKESILDGTHPYADFLLKISGLVSSRSSGNDRVPVIPRYRRLPRSFSNAQNLRLERNDVNVFPSKRCSGALDTEIVGNEEGKRVKSDDSHGEKMKLDVRVDHIASPIRGLVEDSPTRDIPVFKSDFADFHMEGHVSEKGRYVCTTSKQRGQSSAETTEKSLLEVYCVAEGKDGGQHCPQQERSGIVLPDETHHVVSAKESDCNGERGSHVKVTDAALADGSQHNIIADEGKNPVVCKPTDINDLNNKKIDVAKNKLESLTPKCTMNHAYSDTIDWTEQHLCKICSEAGQLLICNTSDCPFAYHEKCLGSEFVCYVKGKFYCPFCHHSLTLSKYFDSKKEASVLRKDLGTFMGIAFGNQPTGFRGMNVDEDLKKGRGKQV